MNYTPKGEPRLRAAMQAELDALARIQAIDPLAAYRNVGMPPPEDPIDRVWRERDAEQDERNRQREKDWALRLRYMR